MKYFILFMVGFTVGQVGATYHWDWVNIILIALISAAASEAAVAIYNTLIVEKD